jgi:hypothetical protein
VNRLLKTGADKAICNLRSMEFSAKTVQPLPLKIVADHYRPFLHNACMSISRQRSAPRCTSVQCGNLQPKTATPHFLSTLVDNNRLTGARSFRAMKTNKLQAVSNRETTQNRPGVSSIAGRNASE